jgi:hypothetical protein
MHYSRDPVIYMFKGSATERLPFQQSEVRDCSSIWHLRVLIYDVNRAKLTGAM